jgi:hypothetical protein
LNTAESGTKQEQFDKRRAPLQFDQPGQSQPGLSAAKSGAARLTISLRSIQAT